MQVGDKVEVVGTVLQITDQSVLVETDPIPGGNPGTQLWFQQSVVQPVPPPAPPTTTAEGTTPPARTPRH